MMVRLLFILTMMMSALTQADVKDVRVWQSPDKTRLVFDLTEPSEHKIFTLSNPDRVVIDLMAALKQSVDGKKKPSGSSAGKSAGKRKKSA